MSIERADGGHVGAFGLAAGLLAALLVVLFAAFPTDTRPCLDEHVIIGQVGKVSIPVTVCDRHQGEPK